MKKLVMAVLIFLPTLNNTVLGQGTVNRSDWQQLQTLAQEIGLCVYMIGLPDDQCKCLQNNGQRSYMGTLDRGWARTRIMAWMASRGQLPNTGILIYDKYTNTAAEGGELARGYFVVGLSEIGKVELRQKSSGYVMRFPSKGQKKAIMNNAYYREFVLRKDGRVLSEGNWAFNTMDGAKAEQFVKLLNKISGNP